MGAADEIFGGKPKADPSKAGQVADGWLYGSDGTPLMNYAPNSRGMGGFGDARDNPNNAMGVFFDPSAKEGDRTGYYNDFLREDLRVHPGGQQASLQDAGIAPGSSGDPSWNGSAYAPMSPYTQMQGYGAAEQQPAAPDAPASDAAGGQAPGPAEPAAGPASPSNFMGGGSGAGGFAGGAGQSGGASNYGGWRKRHAHQFGGDSPAGQIFGKGSF